MRKRKIIPIIAAVLAVAAVGGYMLYKHFSKEDEKDVVNSKILINYENAYYEVIEDDSELLNVKGIESPTESTAGNRITYLTKNESGEYIPTTDKTETELFEYAPFVSKAVKIFKNDGKFFTAVFCNYIITDDECMDSEEIFKIFSATDKDILKIIQTKSNTTLESNGNTIISSDAITQFYTELLKCEKISENAYLEAEFASAETDDDYTKRANDRKDLLIETKSGLRLGLEYYPSYGYVYSSQTQTYYKMTDTFSKWIKVNFK